MPTISSLSKGAWSNATTYNPGDIVTSGGSSYICIATNLNNIPPNVTYWALLASIGATGATGPTGPTGATGSGATVDTDGTLAANSDIKVASQKATKTYVDTSLSTFRTDGWIKSTDTYVYVSANSFKITGADKTLVYKKGTIIKFTNNSIAYYGVVIASVFGTDTTVTLLPNSDFSINNSAITNPFYSYSVNAQGYLGFFNQNSVILTGFSSTTLAKAQYYVTGNKIDIYYVIDGTSNATGFTAALPVNADFTTADAYFGGIFRARDNGSIVTGGGAVSDIESASPGIVTFYKDFVPTAWTNSGAKSLRGNLSYRF